jgi:hypothetical protein
MHWNGLGALGKQSISKDLFNPAAKGKFKQTSLYPNKRLKISKESNHAFTSRLVLSTMEKEAQTIYFYLSENPQRSK